MELHLLHVFSATVTPQTAQDDVGSFRPRKGTPPAWLSEARPVFQLRLVSLSLSWPTFCVGRRSAVSILDRVALRSKSSGLDRAGPLSFARTSVLRRSHHLSLEGWAVQNLALPSLTAASFWLIFNFPMSWPIFRQYLSIPPVSSGGHPPWPDTRWATEASSGAGPTYLDTQIVWDHQSPKSWTYCRFVSPCSSGVKRSPNDIFLSFARAPPMYRG
mmetsp:Transcript_6057/g.12700  ORF Transcript_6057/g.12700 Transcript_6057/m.12700 type:complete len:216 (+) Transcript_6057:497-1144(+)